MKTVLTVILTLSLSGVIGYAWHVERATDCHRSGFEFGSNWEFALMKHCENDKDPEGCVEKLYGAGEAEINAVRETFPNIEDPDRVCL